MPALTGFLALGSIAEGTFTFTELTGAGAYARQAISLSPVGGGRIRNDAAIQFPAITGASWAKFNALAVFDAVTGGNQLMAWRAGSADLNGLLPGKRYRIGNGAIEIIFPVVYSNLGTEVILSGPYSLSPQGPFMTPATLVVTQAEYDAIATKDADTLYYIRSA